MGVGAIYSAVSQQAPHKAQVHAHTARRHIPGDVTLNNYGYIRSMCPCVEFYCASLPSAINKWLKTACPLLIVRVIRV